MSNIKKSTELHSTTATEQVCGDSGAVETSVWGGGGGSCSKQE